MTYSWKLYRKRLLEGLLDAKSRESLFILGIDLGNHSSSLSFYDANRKTVEVLDISGGYGKPSSPTALQYIKDTKEWVFGEYALLSKGTTTDDIFTNLLERLHRKEYFDVGGRPVSAEQVISVYLKELLSNCKNINPKAEFAGIVLSVPSYISEENREAILQTFKLAGYEKPLISIDSDRDCIFSGYFLENQPKNEKVVLLDFGQRAIRGGLYDISVSDESEVFIRCTSSLYAEPGTDAADASLTKQLTEFYVNEQRSKGERADAKVLGQVQSFAYQHKDLVFQRQHGSRPIKLYYNFLYPPIVYTVTDEIGAELVRPHKERFLSFLDRLFKKSITGVSIDKSEADTVICTGGGFEMLWARNLVADVFSGSRIIMGKNPKTLMSQGAAIRAANALGILDIPEFTVEDEHLLKFDIGVNVQFKSQNLKKDKFLPIAESGSFWWQERGDTTFIYTGETGGEDGGITLYKRNGEGELKNLGEISLTGLPKRPPGTTRLSLALSFKTPARVVARLRDVGFGELFPGVDFEREAEISV